MKPAFKGLAGAVAAVALASWGAVHAQWTAPPPPTGMTMPQAHPGQAGAQFQPPHAAMSQQPMGLMAMTPDQLQNMMSAEQLMRSRVRAADGENIGRVEEILASFDGRVTALTISSGGFLGRGATYYRVPANQVEARPAMRELFLRVTRQQLDHFRVADRQQIAPNEWRASDLIKDRVYTSDRVAYGAVQDVFIGLDGRVRAVIISGGGPFDGMFAYPYDPRTFDARRDVHTLPFTRQQVAQFLPISPDALRMVTLGEGRVAGQQPPPHPRRQ
jgi:sporulation protein YlmC with PRC-barrel domain